MLLDSTNDDAILSTLNLYTPSPTFASQRQYQYFDNTERKHHNKCVYFY